MSVSAARASHQRLIGLAIKDAFIDAEQETIVLQTFDGDLYCITHHGDCCEHVYYGHVNLSEHLIGATILKVDELEYQALDTATVTPRNPKTEDFCKLGIAIHTGDGTVTLETRMEGNGNYAGDLSVVKMEPNDMYRIEQDEHGIKTHLLHTSVTGKTTTYTKQYSKLRDF